MDNKILFSPVPLDQFVEAITEAVCAHMDARLRTAPPPDEELLTRVQAARLLGITLPTLRDYTKRGYIAGYRIGSRVRYKRSEVMKGLARMKAAHAPSGSEQ